MSVKQDSRDALEKLERPEREDEQALSAQDFREAFEKLGRPEREDEQALSVRLISFRIENFRSIVDTGFQDLGKDGITTIIGQNESGKTSILEALMAFYSDIIIEDDIRHENSPPMVTCKFHVNGKIKKQLEEKFWNLPHDIDERITKLKNIICIKKTWKPKNISEKPTATIEKVDPLGRGFYPPLPTEPEEEYVEKKKFSVSNFIDEFLQFVPIIFFKNESMLPSEINLADIRDENSDAEGYIGARNFLLLAELSAEEIENLRSNKRYLDNEIDRANNKISKELQEFWSQKLGGDNKISIVLDVNHRDENDVMAGYPYLSFSIKDNNVHLKPKQRSLGVCWFLSFFLTIMAEAKRKKHAEGAAAYSRPVILIDEIGHSLHGKAQKDILRLLENVRENLEIIYATHSPYLVNIGDLHRILVAERKTGQSGRIETKILPPHKFGGSHRDAILPLYSSMGMDLSHQEVIKKNNNVILEEISAFYYLKAFLMLFNIEKEIHFLPATGCNNIRMLANLLLGWGIEFSVLVDDESSGCKTLETLEKNHILLNERLIKIDGCEGIEDIFVKEDFSEFVLHGESIPEDVKTSKYLKKNFSKPTLAADFKVKVEKGEVTNKNLTKETRDNINKLITKIIKSLETHSAS